MKRSIDERGPIAAWLIRSRAQFSWKVADFLGALKAETGWAPTRTTYARWESGAARPDRENLERVEAFYTKRGIAAAVDAPVEAKDAIAAAIDRQTDTLSRIFTALSDELRQGRIEDRERLAAMERAVEALGVSLRPAQATAASTGRSVPQSSVG